MTEKIKESSNNEFINGIVSHIGTASMIEDALNKENFSQDEKNIILNIDREIRDLYKIIFDDDITYFYLNKRLEEIKKSINDTGINLPGVLGELLAKIEKAVLEDNPGKTENKYVK